MKLADVIVFVKSRRPIIDPNAGFMHQLKFFEDNLELERKLD
ncbi:MAG: hypothetical protein Hyperionvirus4_30 [Hyperionvirus sp.]|uniref:Uncharacterized protein n=1 Tax=Hyperionvirus sp. TaxID=2487770 RepID=A0A3G5A747_9VIRU|nr:MAG: hypothetical protein Hyperionvirus4_30 [Hyperionvirus sp.]